jgi:hypothetical protein
VGGLLRSIEDEMNDMITRFGGPTLFDPTLDVLDVAVSGHVCRIARSWVSLNLAMDTHGQHRVCR